MSKESPKSFFQGFEKTIFSKRLKLSAAVHSSTGKKMWELRVNAFDKTMATTNLMKVRPNNKLFWTKFSIFPVFFIKLQKFTNVTVHKHFSLIFFSNFSYYFLPFYENSKIQNVGCKMAGKMTLFDITTNKNGIIILSNHGAI